MKKGFTRFMAWIMGIATIFVFSACSAANPEPSMQPSAEPSSSILPSSTDGSAQDTKALVVYFSAPDSQDNSYVEIN